MAGTGIHPYHQQWPPVPAPPPSATAPPPPPPHPHPHPHQPALPMDNSASRPSNDEVRTIFISGLPEDVKERELQNLLRWLPGYEASQVNFKGEHPMGFALFATGQHAIAAKDALQDMVFDAESKSLLHTEMAKKNLFVKRGIVADSSAYDQSKRMRIGGDYTHTAYSTSPFHPPPPAVWGPHGYMSPAPPHYDPYAGYPVPPVPMPAPAPVPTPSSYVPVQNNKDNPPCNTLFIGNLGENINEDELRGLFSVQPGYKQMKVLRQERHTVCFIEFEDVNSATNVHHTLQGAVIPSSGAVGMRIQYPSVFVFFHNLLAYNIRKMYSIYIHLLLTKKMAEFLFCITELDELHQSCFFLIFLASAATFGVNAVNLEGTTLLSLVRHWKVVPLPIKSSWNASDSTPCSWLGVICNPSNVVIEVNIFSLSISGELGPEIGYLNHLESIDLSFNSFSGAIPSLLGNCSYLESLDLSNNFFNGEIPENLGNLRRLRDLSLWSNNLGGKIPESLFRIPSLRLIYLNNNKLTGSIPRDLGNLSLIETLSLNNNMLSGTIPSSIGNCSELRELYLNDNSFYGALPDSLNSLDHLQFLFVENNNLVGRIPSLGSCKELENLVLSSNRFSGGNPTGLGNCSSLTSLAAVGCGLSGPIPSSLGRLTNISLLYLSENRLSGSIPPELGNCEALTDLQLYGNKLSGAVPSELGMLDQLQIIMLFTNNLSGEIPSSIWRIQSLQQLIVYENDLVGEISNEITELKELNYLSLFDNQFSGVLPQGLGINGSLTHVDLSRNKFIGHIPPNLCFGKKLRRLILGQNHFNGSISSDVGRCTSLTRLILKENSLEGRFPDFVKHSGLEYMDISNNRISGSIPLSLGDLANVSFIDLSHNKLVGGMPLELGSLVNLEYLSLSHNRLDGMMPSQLSGCHKLSELDLRNNLLNGTIPSSLRSLSELSVLDLSENRFGGGVATTLFQLGKLSSLQLGANLLGGAIPTSIGLEVEAQSLRSLNLSRNGLIGRFPVEFGKLKMLEQLDISCNNLSGSLEIIGELRSLTEINVSYNSFTGPIQPAVMKFLISSPSSFVGNQDLCIECGRSCEGSNRSSNAFKMCHSQSRKRGLSPVGLAMVVSGSSVFAVILVLGVSYAFRNKGHEGNLLGDAEEGASSLLRQVMEATENLHEKYIVGRGAHGTVYKVALSPTKAYALKKLSFAGSKGGNASMVREIKTIGSVRHRNLVRFEDFWLRKDYGLILYPYMENGSLHNVLHKSHPRLPLKWEVRYRIALGAAQGLMYLHFDCDPPIIHRDIKPLNILLDSDMEPHISDFGIAKLLDESVSSTQVAVQGTIGYIAPAFSTRSSRESDVYVYGVVLLELVTRRRVLDESFGEGVDVVRWVRGVWDEEEGLGEIVDRDVVDELLDSSLREQVEGVVALALRCTDEDAGKRPSMREVVKQLVVVESRSRSKNR
ncbi:hypothetical protein SASPL_141749 [Salvia splendens]|uniref:non-specific serine/threonine protein kinase n=1 Tax=Salvia splendens TaxID=180675 RepID=A0A8X8WKL5_SALSN|nr:hypothetical protein SASPL_141749 [Salvia splendens]